MFPVASLLLLSIPPAPDLSTFARDAVRMHATGIALLEGGEAYIWSDEALETLAATRSWVDVLTLRGPGVTRKSLALLTRFPRLRELHLSGSVAFSADALVELHRLPRLQIVSLPRFIKDGDLRRLKEIKSLRSLNLNATSLTADGLRELALLPELEELSLPTSARDNSLCHLKNLPNLRRLEIISDGVTDDGLATLQDVTALQSLMLCSVAIKGRGLGKLGALPALRELDIYFLSVDPRSEQGGIGRLSHLETLVMPKGCGDDLVASVGSLSNLRSLDLGLSKVTDDGLRHLSGLDHLRTLRLSNTKITGKGFVHLGCLCQLESLELMCTHTTDEGMAHLERMVGLRHLRLSCTCITNRGMASLKRLRRLESIDLSTNSITDEGLAHIEALTSLRALNICLSDVTGEGLVHLRNLKNLSVLNVSGIKVTDETFRKHLVHFDRLEELDLEGTTITDCCLNDLTKLGNLRNLNLSNTRVTNDGLHHLRDLKRLESLRLCQARVSDAGLASIAECQRLRLLDLSFNRQISDRGLSSLYRMPCLLNLNVQRTDVTEQGVDDLARAQPGIKILY